MLKKEERIALRSLGQKLPDLVLIGKGGVTENVVSQIEDNLNAYELIKVKVLNNSNDDIMEISEQIEHKCNCETVTVIGSKILFYRQSEKKVNKNNQLVRDALKKASK